VSTYYRGKTWTFIVGRYSLAEAQEQFQQALRIKPDFTEARAGLQKVREMLEHTP
jgi:hypothetical protein